MFTHLLTIKAQNEVAMRDNHNSRERNKMLLFHYYQTIKEYGDDARYIGIGRISEIVGEKMHLSPRYTARLINKLRKDRCIENEVQHMLNG